jgi:hypothetical protein
MSHCCIWLAGELQNCQRLGWWMAVTLRSRVRDMFNTDLAMPHSSGCSTPVKLDSYESCAPLGYYATRSGNFFTDVSGQPIGPFFRDQESKSFVVMGFYDCRNKFYSLIYVSVKGTTWKQDT